jgi:hypothetical protein
MSESEFLRGNLASKHLPYAAPTVINAIDKPKRPGSPPVAPCETYITRACGMTLIPGPCDADWVKRNPPPDWFIRDHGQPPWKQQPPSKGR